VQLRVLGSKAMFSLLKSIRESLAGRLSLLRPPRPKPSVRTVHPFLMYIESTYMAACVQRDFSC
jgi:hypothetical protein